MSWFLLVQMHISIVIFSDTLICPAGDDGLLSKRHGQIGWRLGEHNATSGCCNDKHTLLSLM